MTRCSSFFDWRREFQTRTKHLALFVRHRAGATPRNHFGAAKGAKWWGRSRPRRCFGRVLLRWLCSTNAADAALLVACHVLNRDLNGGKRAPFRSEERRVGKEGRC